MISAVLISSRLEIRTSLRSLRSSSAAAELLRPDHGDERVSRRELVTRAEITEELLDQLEAFGLVRTRAGSKFMLDSDVTRAGRHPESDIFLDDITVSRRHAEFQRGNGGYLVRDVGSLNGTYLNRERIDETTLANGDEVQIGKFKLVFLTGGGE